MANILDNLELMKKLDKENLLQNIFDIPDQIEKGWNDIIAMALPTHYMNIENIVLLGMGGSGIGGALCRTLATYQSKIPIIIHNDYDLPGFVDRHSLVIGVSYSGNTEETLSAFKEAGERGAKLIAISTGNKIAALTRKYHCPIYTIEYGCQPRSAIGFLFSTVLGLFFKLDVVEFDKEFILEALVLLKAQAKKLRPEIPSYQNPAKHLAKRIQGYIPIIIGSGTLSEVARRWKCQFNENAKQAAFYEILPECDHNFIVGFDFPQKLSQKMFVIFLQSAHDHPRTKLRQAITIQIVQKKKIPYDTFIIQPKTNPIAEMLQVVQFGDYVSYYLGILNNIDPNDIESIVYLKDKLSLKS